MMKKIIAVILSFAILLCASAAMAEAAEKVTIGSVSINGVFRLQCGLPEGYTPYPGTITPDQVTAVIRSEDPDAPMMQLSVAYDEMYSDVDRLNDLGEEDLKLLEQTFIDNDPDVEISYGETGYGTLLLIARHESEGMDYVTFFSIYKGYCVEFALVPSPDAEDKNLTEDQLKISVDFLTELDFIPATEGALKKVPAGTYVTRLTDYNPEDNTVKAEVLQEILLDREVVDALEVGDTLTIGDDTIGVPWIRNGAWFVGEIKQIEDTAFRIVSKNPPHIAQIHLIHADEQIVLFRIATRQLDGFMPPQRNVVSIQQTDRARMDTVADLLRARGGGSSRNVFSSSLMQKIRHDHFRHRRTADVAVAHEHDAAHGKRQMCNGTAHRFMASFISAMRFFA